MPAVRAAWPNRASPHVTLKFLGPTPIDRYEPIEGEALRIAKETGSFTVAFRGLGKFGRHRSPVVVLWLGIHESTGSLARLARQLDEALTPWGIPAEKRPFSPHLTLARIRNEGKMKELDRILKDPQNGLELGRCRVREMVLYESRTLPSGAEYRELKRYPFGND